MPQKKDKLKITIDISIYPLEAVYGASSVFIDKTYIFLSNFKNNKIDIEFKKKDERGNYDLKKLEGEFMNELINFVYRINISKTNKKMREHIVHRALYSSIGDSLLGGGDEENDIDKNDPLGIKNPWNE